MFFPQKITCFFQFPVFIIYSWVWSIYVIFYGHLLYILSSSCCCVLAESFIIGIFLIRFINYCIFTFIQFFSRSRTFFSSLSLSSVLRFQCAVSLCRFCFLVGNVNSLECRRGIEMRMKNGKMVNGTNGFIIIVWVSVSTRWTRAWNTSNRLMQQHQH